MNEKQIRLIHVLHDLDAAYMKHRDPAVLVIRLREITNEIENLCLEMSRMDFMEAVQYKIDKQA